MTDITVGSASSVLSRRLSARNLVWASPDVGYMFFIDNLTDVSFEKTIDAGSTWQFTSIKPDIGTSTIQVWYDGWTRGITGSLIHITYGENQSDDIHYRTLDVTDDSLGAEQVAIAGTTLIASSWSTSLISITKSRGGNLYIGGWIDNTAENDFVRSTDAGSTWGARTSPITGSRVDRMMFCPASGADDQDMWCMYVEASNDANIGSMVFKLYDDSANTFNTTDDALGTGLNLNSLVNNMDFVPRHSDDHGILAYWTETDSSTADLRVWDIGGSNLVTEKTAISTDTDDIIQIALTINQQNDDIYAAFLGSLNGLEAANAGINTFYVKSTDGGDVWGNSVQVSAGSDDFREVYLGTSIGDDGGKIQPIWYNDDLNTIITNVENSVTIDAAAAAAVAIYAHQYSDPFINITNFVQ